MKTINVKIPINPGNGVDVKGRNGYFGLNEVYIWNRAIGPREAIQSKSGNWVYVNFYSQKKGNAAPALIEGDAENVKALLEQILAVIDSTMESTNAV
jgi:hypothetical protein